MTRKPSSTARGLGWAHQQARAAMPPPSGEPCPYCHEPMWPDQRLDLDHSVARALGGGGAYRWAHSRCNSAAGGRLGNQIRWQGAVPKRSWVNRWA